MDPCEVIRVLKFYQVDFTVDQVEGALSRSFGDKSKKEVCLMDSPHVISVSNGRVKPGAQRNYHGIEGAQTWFYCFQSGHFKLDCRIKATDRDPNRAGGSLFRTDVNTAPGAKWAKKTNNTAFTTIKAMYVDDKAMDDIDSLDPAHHEGFEDNGNSAQTPTGSAQSMEDIDAEGLKGIKLTDDILAKGHIFTYGIGTVSHSTLKGSIKLNIVNPNRQLLSACNLAKQGYRYFQSKTVEFLFEFGKGCKLLFAAIAIGEVYFLPIVKPSKIFSTQVSQFGDIMKEWHLRLGHVGNERLNRTISN
ncbi:hypothetical protein PHPALM_30599 [Phytophthora palmivora]|uniref:GAG-pre-integrase domain-containing protein n=1 Tax=Phytophthora palmivora TaxID=4796 RepID=A0A2P4X4R3_9STRA|nr:hypothetical protein PHPALM_30599 [Phytophthora palmivora]